MKQLKIVMTVLGYFLLIATAQAAANDPQAGKTFRDCPDCPEMVVIPPGSFDMGSPRFEAGLNDTEGPVHRVNISAFALGKTEITRGQFATFVSETNYNAGDNCLTFEDGKWEERNGRNWRDPGYLQEDSHPAACLSWNDAKAYTEWLSRKTGKQYRLPTEAEWEYAARGNTGTARYWGDSTDQACGYANVGDAAMKAQVQGVAWDTHNCTDGYAYTAPVGSFKANAFGLNDMIGNVWEWVEDSFHNSYEGAPTDARVWQGDGTKRVLRGGSWIHEPLDAQAASRHWFEPSFRDFSFGFRLARMLP